MKLLIAFLAIYVTPQLTNASGCGGPDGGGISNIKVLTTQEITDYKVMAWAPSVIQIKHNGKQVSLINTDGKGVLRFPGGELILERISFDEYDGCDSYDTRRTNRYKLKVRDTYIKADFVWPLIAEYDSSALEYNYLAGSLIKE